MKKKKIKFLLIFKKKSEKTGDMWKISQSFFQKWKHCEKFHNQFWNFFFRFENFFFDLEIFFSFWFFFSFLKISKKKFPKLIVKNFTIDFFLILKFFFRFENFQKNHFQNWFLKKKIEFLHQKNHFFFKNDF